MDISLLILYMALGRSPSTRCLLWLRSPDRESAKKSSLCSLAAPSCKASSRILLGLSYLKGSQSMSGLVILWLPEKTNNPKMVTQTKTATPTSPRIRPTTPPPPPAKKKTVVSAISQEILSFGLAFPSALLAEGIPLNGDVLTEDINHLLVGWWPS